MVAIINKIKLTPRQLSLIGMVICMLVLVTAFYLQFHYDLEPCPLCILQRLVFLALGILFFGGAALWVTKIIRRIYDSFVLLVTLLGASLALWQVHLQHSHAKDLPSCGADLGYLLQNFPFSQALQLILQGTGDCAKVDLTIMGFSIAELSVMAFLLLAILCVIQIMPREK